MPHFTLQVDQNGPLLNVFFGVSSARQTALTTAGQKVPTIFQARGLVDTGASCTCIDPAIIAALTLQPTGKGTVNTPSTGKTPKVVDQYDVSLIIPAGQQGEVPLIRPTIAVIEAELLQMQGFHALIGRDVLARCQLTYNGQRGFYTLAY